MNIVVKSSELVKQNRVFLCKRKMRRGRRRENHQQEKRIIRKLIVKEQNKEDVGEGRGRRKK